MDCALSKIQEENVHLGAGRNYQVLNSVCCCAATPSNLLICIDLAPLSKMTFVFLKKEVTDPQTLLQPIIHAIVTSQLSIHPS